MPNHEPSHERPAAPRRGYATALLSLLALLLPTAACAGSVSGTCVEAGARTPLAGVEVVLRRATDSTVVAHAATGTNGRFRLDSLATGRYLLRASLLGHVSYVRGDVVLGAGAGVLDLGTLALAVSPIAIPGVETHTAPATTIIAPDRNIYLTKDMPSATTGSATDVLRSVPELDLDMNDHVSLRGSTSVNIQINGRKPPMQGEDLVTYLRQMPASRIERVEVIANPSAKFDPEGAAGIVNIVLKDNVSLGLSGNVTASAGNRSGTPSARVAWQQGPVTLFGGLSGSLYRRPYGSSFTRRNLLVSPASRYEGSSDLRSEGGGGTGDLSVDVALSKRSTLYGTVYDGFGRNHNRTTTLDAFTDTTLAVTMSHDGEGDGHSHNGYASVTLGFQNVVKKGKDERSIEFLETDSDGGGHGDGVRRTLLPAGTPDQAVRQVSANGAHQRSLKADDTHPLGAHGTLETGYYLVDRRTTSSSELDLLENGAPVVTATSGAADFTHREVFHQGYVTVGSTFRRLSMQLGARGELATTTFDVLKIARHDEHDYRSLYPSANVAWDFGKGRNVRLSYSRRVERPMAYLLSPVVLTVDSLNRSMGNPALGPQYTHSYTLGASWSGSRGTLWLSPYLNETVDNWDRVTTVDAAGVATTTYRNASSVRRVGVSVGASLRQTGRVGGTLGFGVSQEHHDASNLGSQYRRDVTGWSANANVTVRTTKTLDLQGYLRYAPPSALAQGRSSRYIGSNLGAKLKFGDRAWANVSVNDPFNLSHFWSTTGDATYEQRSTQDNRMRAISGAFTWTWGKPPEQKQRKQSADPPQAESPQ